MRIRSPIEERKARIEIIPLIDIMFFLLACFMIVSLKMIQMRGVKVDLPIAQKSQPVKKSDFISVSIDHAGTIYYQAQPSDQPRVVDKDEFEELLKAVLAAKPAEPPRVYIRADQDATHGEVMDVLDRAKVAGIEKVAFETRKETVGMPTPASAPAAPAPPAPPQP